MRLFFSFVYVMSAIGLDSSQASAQESQNRRATASFFLQRSLGVIKARNLQRTTPFFRIESAKKKIQLAIVMDGTESMLKEFADLKRDFKRLVGGLADLKSRQAKEEKKDSAESSEAKLFTETTKGTAIDVQLPDPSLLEFATVIYRDDSATGGPLVIPTKEFVGAKKFLSLFEKIDVDTGFPNFEERVDEGLYAALTDLNWAPADDEDVTRWILWCGDAPPYPHEVEKYGGDEKARNAQRPHSRDELIQIAKDKEIHIYAIQTVSGFFRNNEAEELKARPLLIGQNVNLLTSFNKAKERTSLFMTKIADETSGRFADMWSEESFKAALGAGQSEPMRIPTLEEINKAASKPMYGREKAGPEIRVAILPHKPFVELQPWLKTEDDNDKGQNQFTMLSQPFMSYSSRISQTLRNVGNGTLTPIDNQEVTTALARAIKENPNAEDSEILYAVAQETGAEFLFWGNYDGQDVFSTGVYDETGELIGAHQKEVKPTLPDKIKENERLKLVAQTIQKLCSNIGGTAGKLPKDVQDAFYKKEGDSRVKVIPISTDLSAQHEMLAGIKHLEWALEFAKKQANQSNGGSTKNPGEQHLLKAVECFKSALDYEESNPYTNHLLACCYYNLSTSGTDDDYQQKFHEYRKLAYENRNEISSLAKQIIREIEAYHGLFEKEDIPGAIKRFEELAKTNPRVNGDFARRAHWMLAGIYLGDWDVRSVDRKVLSVEKAREHVIQILASWPESAEAKFFRKHLMLNEDNRPNPEASPGNKQSVPLESNPSLGFTAA